MTAVHVMCAGVILKTRRIVMVAVSNVHTTEMNWYQEEILQEINHWLDGGELYPTMLAALEGGKRGKNSNRRITGTTQRSKTKTTQRR